MANTLFIGKVYYRFDELPSTNDRAAELLAKSKPPEGTVVRADSQSAGRGQFGSRWESAAGKNLTLSIVLYPNWLEVSAQFYLSMAVALGVRDAVLALNPTPDPSPDGRGAATHTAEHATSPLPSGEGSGVGSHTAQSTIPALPPSETPTDTTEHVTSPLPSGEGSGVGSHTAQSTIPASFPSENPTDTAEHATSPLPSGEGSGVGLKWPNDLYIGPRKAGGILIQNSLSGQFLQSSVVGIGLNVNQMEFDPGLPNPTSLALHSGRSFDLDVVAGRLFECLERRYLQLKSGQQAAIKAAYEQSLFRLGTPAVFIRTHDGSSFEGIIRGVTETGRLRVQTETGEEFFDLKEIRFGN